MRLGEPVAPPRNLVLASLPLRPSEGGCRDCSPTAEVNSQARQVPVCINSAEVFGHQVRWVGQTRGLEELEVLISDLVLKTQVANIQMPELAEPGPPDDAYGSAGINVHSCANYYPETLQQGHQA